MICSTCNNPSPFAYARERGGMEFCSRTCWENYRQQPKENGNGSNRPNHPDGQGLFRGVHGDGSRSRFESLPKGGHR